ncbi:MAG TPA: FeoA family protein [Thermoanaerobaculia bacterium]|nr:FeoA family protein [Thermoanaerobaculia bacterium]
MRIVLNKSDRRAGLPAPETLADLLAGESGVLTDMDLPEPDARRLMELGFLPGSVIVAARSAPGGDPRVYRVEGTEFALRGETAKHIRLDASSVVRAAEEGR